MSKQAIIYLIILSILVPELWSKPRTKTKMEMPTFSESVKRQSEEIDYFLINGSSHDSDSIDVTNPGRNLTALDNQGKTDNAANLQRIITYASRNGKSVYFPPGRYLIDSDVIIKDDVRLFGSSAGISLIETSSGKNRHTAMANIIGNNQGNIQVHSLFFDGVNLRFGNADELRAKSHIYLSECVFFSKNPPGATADVNKPAVQFKSITFGAMNYSVFLRDRDAFGVGSAFDFSVGVSISNNIFGIDLGRMDWMDTELGESYWSTLKLKLDFLKRRFGLHNDQGYFKSSIYSGFTNESIIQKNIFNGSPNSASLHHDHVVYLKGFDDMKYIENYARGWPSNAGGGIKARNGKNLVIARNYIYDTGILLYTHMTGKPKIVPLYLGLKNVLVYGNYIVEKTNLGHRTAGIAYFEPGQKKLGNGNDENLKYSANVFEIVGASHSPPQTRCIFLTNGNIPEHHVYRDNVYADTDVSVELEARKVSPSYESGSISSTLVAPYVDMNLPNYTIPKYA